MANIEKITETTKVREWVERINDIIDEVSLREYVWETVSEYGKQEYTFAKVFPTNSKFIVTYASIELYESDYTLEGTTLTFISPTLEDGYPIKIRYVGSK